MNKLPQLTSVSTYELTTHSMSDISLTLELTDNVLCRIGNIVNRNIMAQAFRQLKKYRKRKDNLAYALVSRMPQRYQKDMLNIVDYYEATIEQMAKCAMDAEARLHEQRKKYKKDKIDAAKVECHQWKTKVDMLETAIKADRDEMQRLTDELQFYSQRQMQMSEQMSALVNQLITAEMNSSQTAVEIEQLQKELLREQETRQELEQELKNSKEKQQQLIVKRAELILQNEILKRDQTELKKEIVKMRWQQKGHKQNCISSEMEEYFSPVLGGDSDRMPLTDRTDRSTKSKFSIETVKRKLRS